MAVNGEYGGLGLRVANHEWPTAGKFAYEWLPDTNALTRACFISKAAGLRSRRGDHR
jgi:hypothetical protein